MIFPAAATAHPTDRASPDTYRSLSFRPPNGDNFHVAGNSRNYQVVLAHNEGAQLERILQPVQSDSQVIPHTDFEDEVRRLNAERHARGVSCWQQLVSMIFRQLGHAHSLREFEQGLPPVPI